MAVTYQKPKDDDTPWDQRLVNYGQNTNSGLDEYKRAMGVYRSKSALGDTAGAADAQKWAGQVDTAIGGIGSRPGSETRNVLETYKANLNKPVTPYNFDINNNQQYQQALQAAQRSAQTAGNNATVALGSRGIGNSQQAMTTANQIQQRSVADVNANMLPQIMSQDYSRYRDSIMDQQKQNEGLLTYANALNGLDQQDLDNKYRNDTFAENKKQSNIDLAKWGQTMYGFGAPKEDAGTFFDQYKGAKSLPFQQFEYGQSQDKLKFDYGKEQDAINNSRAERQLNATLSNMSADNVRANKSLALQQGDKELAIKFDIWEKTGLAPDGIPGVPKGTPLAGKNGAGNGVNMNDEVDGLMSSLRGGKLTPELALRQLEEDFSLGHYTKPQYDQLKSTIVKVSPNYSSPAAALTPEQENDIPSDRELDRMVPKGVPAMDWRSWYKDPRGRSAGVSFENWQQLFGPRLEAKR